MIPFQRGHVEVCFASTGVCWHLVFEIMDLIDPLFDAVIKGDDSVVNHVLSLGISLTVNDEDGLTVLHW